MTSIDNRITSFCQIKMEVFIKLKVVSNAIDFKLLGDRPFVLLILVCVCAFVCVRACIRVCVCEICGLLSW